MSTDMRNWTPASCPCTFDELRQEVGGALGLLYAVALHDQAVPVDADVPGPARLCLAVQDGRVGHVVVLKYTLLELTLGREEFLEDTHTQRHTQIHTHTDTHRHRC